MAYPNLETLKIFDTVFNGAFAGGVAKATDEYKLIATVLPSTAASNTYAWLNAFPKMREWVGDRLSVGLDKFQAHQIWNKHWEQTIAVPKKDLEDDNFGMYSVIAQEMGLEAVNHKTELCFSALYNGAEAGSKGYDEVPFFSDSHPVGDGTASNFQAGAGEPWVLFDDTHAVKPIIFQLRREGELVSMNSVNDQGVFYAKEAVWGMDARYNAGYGLWQLAAMSKATLNEDNLSAMRAQMRGLKGETGKRLNIRPTRLIVGPELETTALKLVESMNLANGESNIMKGAFQVHVSNFFAE